MRGSSCLSASRGSKSPLHCFPHTCSSCARMRPGSRNPFSSISHKHGCPYTGFPTSPCKHPAAACLSARHWMEVEDRVLSSYRMTPLVPFGGFQMVGDPLNDHTFSDTAWQSLGPTVEHLLTSRLDTPNLDSCAFPDALTLCLVMLSIK